MLTRRWRERYCYRYSLMYRVNWTRSMILAVCCRGLIAPYAMILAIIFRHFTDTFLGSTSLMFSPPSRLIRSSRSLTLQLNAGLLLFSGDMVYNRAWNSRLVIRRTLGSETKRRTFGIRVFGVHMQLAVPLWLLSSGFIVRLTLT